MHNRGLGVPKIAGSSITSLATQAAERLRSEILSGGFAPGERLKIEHLAAVTGASSTPVREALARLTSEGLVAFDDHRGFSVTPVSEGEFRDIVRVRILLESEALQDAIAHGGDDWEAAVLASFHRLSVLEKRMPKVAPSLNEEWAARHREFHTALISACTSPELKRLCAQYFDRAARYRRISAKFRSVPRNKSNEHGRIMRAALSRQTVEAVRLIEKHIGHTLESVSEALRTNSESQKTLHRK